MTWHRIEKLVDETVTLISQAHDDLVRLFRQCWLRLAEDGHCDGLDGAEYNRVLALWIKANWPPTVRQFVLTNANLPAPTCASTGAAKGGEGS